MTDLYDSECRHTVTCDDCNTSWKHCAKPNNYVEKLKMTGPEIQ